MAKRRMARARSYARRSKRRGRKAPMPWTHKLGGAMAAAVLVTPYATGGTAAAIKSGNLAGAIPAFVEDSKKALSPGNLAIALVPAFTVIGASKLRGAIGLKPVKFGRRAII